MFIYKNEVHSKKYEYPCSEILEGIVRYCKKKSAKISTFHLNLYIHFYKFIFVQLNVNLHSN